jgi:Protein of unknown function (DUF4058)
MPSPFPGMDPYLEGYLWPDVHATMIHGIRAVIAGQLPDGYVARIDQYVWVQDVDEEEKWLRGKSDAFVIETEDNHSKTAAKAAIAEPTVIVTFPASKKVGNRVIKIIDQKDRRVVTVIELLSPANKTTGEDRTFYLDKRKEYLATGTNLVEIDLLRDGDRLPMGRPKPRSADYYIVVSRAVEFPQVRIWALTVREPLPTIPIPLKEEDSDVAISLQTCLDGAYDEARYEKEIDYTQPPEPQLRKSDAEWAAELLKKPTKKTKK